MDLELGRKYASHLIIILRVPFANQNKQNTFVILKFILKYLFIIQMSYQLSQEELIKTIQNHNWSDIQNNIPQIPSGLYTFQPKQNNKIYYQRLLYCLNVQQQSDRALSLSSYMLYLNTSNYYALMLHSDCFKIKIQNKQLEQSYLVNQLNFINSLLLINSKQYQIWNYKKDLFTWIKKYGVKIDMNTIRLSEDSFIFDLMVNQDQRNYHIWDFKTWFTRYLGNVQEQIKNTQSMIFTQYNNAQLKCSTIWTNCYSCWSYRFNLILDLPSQQSRLVRIRQDLQKCIDFLKINPESQCAWNYLAGLINCKEIRVEQKQQTINKIYQFTKIMGDNRLGWSFLLQNCTNKMKNEAIQNLIKIDRPRHQYYAYIKQKQQSL